MEWYQGELGDAIASVKSSKKRLLVLVFGKDEEASKELLSSLESCADIAKNYVCLRLEASSLGAAQLNAFYPVLVVPLIYLISHDGRALESICGRATAEEIRQKLSQVDDQEGTEIAEESKPETAETTPEAGPSVAAVVASPENDSAPGIQGDDTPDAPVTSDDLAERQAAAQEQVAVIRRRKMEEEAERERLKEVERREVGQRMTELKRFQREQEQKELREEIARKRKEEREARDRVRRQIEEDRRERMARSNAGASPVSSSSTTATAAVAAAPGASTVSGEGDTRLQFRLPDGTNVVRSFRSGAPLREAFDFIGAELNGRLGTFRISSLYPRRLFGPDDMEVSLLDLALCPSAALVVMPGGGSSSGGGRGGVVTPSSGGGSVVDLVLAPFLMLWGILCSLVAALVALVRPAPAVTAAATPSSRSAPANNANAERQRRVGGVNRLGDLPRDDNDANTWNGNSTQQM